MACEQAEDADRATARAEAADDDRAAVLSRLQQVHAEKARQMNENVAAVEQVKSSSGSLCTKYGEFFPGQIIYAVSNKHVLQGFHAMHPALYHVCIYMTDCEIAWGVLHAGGC